MRDNLITLFIVFTDFALDHIIAIQTLMLFRLQIFKTFITAA